MHEDWEGFWDSLVLVALGLLQASELFTLASPGKALLVQCCRHWLEAQLTDSPTFRDIWTVRWPVSTTVSPRIWGDWLSHQHLHSPTSCQHLVLSSFYFLTPLVDVKWISEFSCAFPRLLIKLTSHLDFLCVKCPFFFYTISFLTIVILHIFWILILCSYMCYK